LADFEPSAYFLDTLSGLSTIRAFGWTEMTQSELHHLLDLSQKPYYLLFMVQQWLSFVLDLVVAVVAVVIVAVAVSLGSRSSSIGVALIQVISFNGILRQAIVSWTQIETSIAAVTRIREFEEGTPSEYDENDRNEPSPGWPWRGQVEFETASAAYQ
jgi:ATP-binding cassette subfamily C (CFTR/MRP) protein 1